MSVRSKQGSLSSSKVSTGTRHNSPRDSVRGSRSLPDTPSRRRCSCGNLIVHNRQGTKSSENSVFDRLFDTRLTYEEKLRKSIVLKREEEAREFTFSPKTNFSRRGLTASIDGGSEVGSFSFDDASSVASSSVMSEGRSPSVVMSDQKRNRRATKARREFLDGQLCTQCMLKETGQSTLVLSEMEMEMERKRKSRSQFRSPGGSRSSTISPSRSTTRSSSRGSAGTLTPPRYIGLSPTISRRTPGGLGLAKRQDDSITTADSTTDESPASIDSDYTRAIDDILGGWVPSSSACLSVNRLPSEDHDYDIVEEGEELEDEDDDGGAPHSHGISNESNKMAPENDFTTQADKKEEQHDYGDTPSLSPETQDLDDEDHTNYQESAENTNNLTSNPDSTKALTENMADVEMEEEVHNHDPLRLLTVDTQNLDDELYEGNEIEETQTNEGVELVNEDSNVDVPGSDGTDGVIIVSSQSEEIRSEDNPAETIHTNKEKDPDFETEVIAGKAAFTEHSHEETGEAVELIVHANKKENDEISAVAEGGSVVDRSGFNNEAGSDGKANAQPQNIDTTVGMRTFDDDNDVPYDEEADAKREVTAPSSRQNETSAKSPKTISSPSERKGATINVLATLRREKDENSTDSSEKKTPSLSVVVEAVVQNSPAVENAPNARDILQDERVREAVRGVARAAGHILAGVNVNKEEAFHISDKDNEDEPASMDGKGKSMINLSKKDGGKSGAFHEQDEVMKPASAPSSVPDSALSPKDPEDNNNNTGVVPRLILEEDDSHDSSANSAHTPLEGQTPGRDQEELARKVREARKFHSEDGPRGAKRIRLPNPQSKTVVDLDDFADEEERRATLEKIDENCVAHLGAERKVSPANSFTQQQRGISHAASRAPGKKITRKLSLSVPPSVSKGNSPKKRRSWGSRKFKEAATDGASSTNARKRPTTTNRGLDTISMADTTSAGQRSSTDNNDDDEEGQAWSWLDCFNCSVCIPVNNDSYIDPNSKSSISGTFKREVDLVSTAEEEEGESHHDDEISPKAQSPRNARRKKGKTEASR